MGGPYRQLQGCSMTHRILRPATAFSLDPRSAMQKKPAQKHKTHREWIKTLPCLVTGQRPVDVAHISYADPRYGKPAKGLGEKANDQWVVPLHRTEHDKQHSMREQTYWKEVGIDPCQVASALWVATGDDEAAAIILRSAG